MRFFYLPWSQLTAEEQEHAIRQVRSWGQLTAQREATRYRRHRGDPPPAPRPVSYLDLVRIFAPRWWCRQWDRMTIAELCADWRPCHYVDARERERRARAGEPVLPQDAPTLGLRVTEARDRWKAAWRDYREESALCKPEETAPSTRPHHLAKGRAYLRMIEAEEEYWLAAMLARVAGWKPYGSLEPVGELPASPKH